MMTTLFGTEHFGFIAGAYGVTLVSLLATLGWIVLTHKSRKRALASLEEAGIRRSSASQPANSPS